MICAYSDASRIKLISPSFKNDRSANIRFSANSIRELSDTRINFGRMIASQLKLNSDWNEEKPIIAPWVSLVAFTVPVIVALIPLRCKFYVCAALCDPWSSNAWSKTRSIFILQSTQMFHSNSYTVPEWKSNPFSRDSLLCSIHYCTDNYD